MEPNRPLPTDGRPAPDAAPTDGAPAARRVTAHADAVRDERPDSERVTGGATPPPEDHVVELRDLEKAFGTKKVLRGVDLALKRGTSAVVLGGSGTGKSVLTKHIVGLLRPDAGEVWVLGDRVDLMDGDALDQKRIHIGYLFQGGALLDSMTVYGNMRFFLDRHTKLSKAEKDDEIQEVLEAVSLPQVGDQYPAELSGGQRKRIGLARALILKPEIILYDEPTTGLDPVSVRVVSELIVKLRDERGISSIAITHDLLAAEIITDEAHFLYEGEIVAAGTLDEVRRSEHPALQEFFKGTEAYGSG